MKFEFQKRAQIFNETKEQLREAIERFNALLAERAEMCESDSADLREVEKEIMLIGDGKSVPEIDDWRKQYPEFRRWIFFREVVYRIGAKCRDVTVSNAKKAVFDESVGIALHKEGDPWYQSNLNTYSKLLAEFDFEHVSSMVLKFEEQGDKSELEIYLSKYGPEVIDALPHILQEPDYSGEFDSIVERRSCFVEQRALESNEASSK